MYAAVIRAADRWRGIPIGEFEQRQLRAIRDELGRATRRQVDMRSLQSEDHGKRVDEGGPALRTSIVAGGRFPLDSLEGHDRHAASDLNRARHVIDAENDVPLGRDIDRVDVDTRLRHHERDITQHAWLV
jgi:hypothetical protein